MSSNQEILSVSTDLSLVVIAAVLSLGVAVITGHMAGQRAARATAKDQTDDHTRRLVALETTLNERGNLARDHEQRLTSLERKVTGLCIKIDHLIVENKKDHDQVVAAIQGLRSNERSDHELARLIAEEVKKVIT